MGGLFIMSKICKECGIDKPFSEYTRSKNVKDGYENKCKECRRLARLKYKIACESCGKVFKSARKETRFCSNACIALSRVERVTLTCSYCNSKIQVKPYKVGQHDDYYCDQSCRTEHLKITMKGNNNPNYNRVEYSCDGCGERLKVHPYKAKNQNFIFCTNECYKENIGRYFSQENNNNWNSELTYEERIIGRNYPEYHVWRESVFERDKYTCQCCYDKKGGNLIGHHILNYSEHEELRTEISNGLTLCASCHTEYHNTYGYTQNNEKQLKQFINEYQDKQASS